MKKKYLSLVMAAMMSLGVAVQASAATAASQTYNQSVADGINASVGVSGSVSNNQGQAPEGRLEVELPTAMSFSVNQAGELSGTDYTVTNKSSVGIVVSVAEFTTVDGDIEVVEKTDLEGEGKKNKARNTVALQLKGIKEVDLGNLSGDAEARTVLKVAKNSSNNMSLIGQAGTKVSQESNIDNESDETLKKVDKNGATGNFRLLFRVEKDSSEA